MQINFKLRIKDGQLEIIDDDGVRLNLDNVANEIHKARMSKREELINFMAVGIVAEKKLSIKYILEFQKRVCSAGISRFVFVVNNGDHLETRFQNKGIAVNGCYPILKNDEIFMDENFISPHDEWMYQELITNMKFKYQTFEKFEILIDKKVQIKGVVVPDEMLVHKFKDLINNHTNMIYTFSLETSYTDYIKVLSAHFEAAYSLRKEHQTIFYDKYIDDYDDEKEKAYKNEQDSLRKIYPILKIDHIKY